MLRLDSPIKRPVMRIGHVTSRDTITPTTASGWESEGREGDSFCPSRFASGPRGGLTNDLNNIDARKPSPPATQARIQDKSCSRLKQREASYRN